MYDAYKNQRPQYWYFIILMPFGELVYFFVHKWPEISGRSEHRAVQRLSGGQRRPDIAALKWQATESPSFVNRLRLAQGLYDADLFAEAEKEFLELGRRDPDSLEVCYGMALTLVEQARVDEALPFLECIVDTKRNYRDYDAFMRLARAYWDSGKRALANDCLAQLCKATQRLSHQLIYARCLHDSDRSDEAKQVLADAIDALEIDGSNVRKDDKQVLQEAKHFLAELRA